MNQDECSHERNGDGEYKEKSRDMGDRVKICNIYIRSEFQKEKSKRQ